MAVFMNLCILLWIYKKNPIIDTYVRIHMQPGTLADEAGGN